MKEGRRCNTYSWLSAARSPSSDGIVLVKALLDKLLCRATCYLQRGFMTKNQYKTGQNMTKTKGNTQNTHNMKEGEKM